MTEEERIAAKLAEEDRIATAAIEYARERGKEDGLAAASWVFDGNTDRETYARTLRGIEEGDPAILDALPFPDLSGQWADSLTGPQLIADALQHADADLDEEAAQTIGNALAETLGADICAEYEDGFNDAAIGEVERVARYQLAE